MKKILLLLVLLVMAVGVQAQTAAGRTASTKVSDALGLMPARDQAEFGRLMDDLVSTGAEGIDLMTSMFEDTNNVPVSYALSGWAAYVSAPGREAARKSFAEGIARALKKSGDPVVQAYYIRLLQRCGGDESVPVLAEYLGDGQLGDPARCALLAIGTPAARALVPEETSLTIHYDAPVGRIADLYAQVQRKGESAVPQLLKALKNSDRAYRNAALRFIQPYLGEPVYNALVKELKKAKPEVKSDIITYLGLQNAQSALPAILPYIGDADPEVSTAAMWAATRMGAPEAPAAIAAVMSDEQTPDAVREAARDCLQRFRTARLQVRWMPCRFCRNAVRPIKPISYWRRPEATMLKWLRPLTPHCKMSWERVSSRRSIRWSDRPTVYACRWPSRR